MNGADWWQQHELDLLEERLYLLQGRMEMERISAQNWHDYVERKNLNEIPEPEQTDAD